MNYYKTSVNGRRDGNEDGHTAIINLNGTKNINNINLFGIYDGHGGSHISKYLEKNIPKIYMDKKYGNPISKEQHIKIFNYIQKKILETKYGYSMGSTCLLCIFYKYNNDLYLNTLNIGDTRAVLINNDNTVIQLTTDHTPNEPNEKKRIKKLGGIINNDNGIYRIKELSVSRVFGDGDTLPYVSHIPDINYIKINNNHKYIIMACDGFWDVINNNELPTLISQNTHKNLAIFLTKEALKRNTTDNVSIIIIELLHF
jgi:serine/threonine protein phosphatase PrpC